jgi:arylsulfatase A-like enzyme
MRRPQAHRVVVCVFDGLRPDLVTAERMPNLARFAGTGTWFREARSVFPSMTRVATTSIATGAPPAVHGIVGNAFLFRQATRSHVIDTGRADDIALAERATAGRFVEVPTFADCLAREGRQVAVVHTGSAGSAHLINPRVKANRHWTFSVLGRDHTGTPEAVDEAIARFGPLPPRELPRHEEVDYATTVFVERVLAELQPAVGLIWFNEPDTSFHYRGIGSPDSLSILRHVDAAFGRILDWLEARPDRDRYAVIAASDHGQISTADQVDVAQLLEDAGHCAVWGSRRSLEGADLCLTGGNMGEIRILEGGERRRRRIADLLMEHPSTGMLFSPGRNGIEGEIPGTFAFGLVGLDHARGPDLVYALRSAEDRDPYDLPGLGLVTGGIPQGGGMHGGLNRFELTTVLMIRAPGLDAGRVDRSPRGIIDIAPTILGLLGSAPAPTMTGRSLVAPAGSDPVRSFSLSQGTFRQTIMVAGETGRQILVQGASGASSGR